MARKSAIDPEELERMKFRAMCRFRAIGRMAMVNAGWMLSDAISANIKEENVRKSIFQKYLEMSKRKQILTFEDKALLNHPISWRSEEEKKHLYRIIGGLKCFRSYPKRVRRYLAAVSYFKYYGPNRVIIREGHMPKAMYFVISGILLQTQRTFDIVTQQWENTDSGKLITGDVFGHDSLLHDIPRVKTCTTFTGCELLCIMKEDFKNVLQSTIQSQWDEIHAAMSRFTYFSTFSEIAIREGCMLAKMKSYKADETILGDGKGVPNFVYFILSGQCTIIETLFVTVKKQGRRTFYSLYNQKEFVAPGETRLIVSTKVEPNNTETPKNTETSKNDIEETKNDTDETKNNAEEPRLYENVEASPSSKNVEAEELHIDQKKSNEKVIGSSSRTSVNQRHISINIMKNETHKYDNKPTKIIADDWDKASILSTRSRSTDSSKDSMSNISIKQFSIRSLENLPKNVRVFFMQVCLMNAGGCFGLGETMKNRRINAIGEVHCLLLPRHWLWQWNPANIWSRIKHFLDRKIPTTEKVFEEFELNRRWNDYKDSIIKEVFQNKKAVNPTCIHDVPYSIRIDQNYDLDVCTRKQKTKHRH